MTNTNDKATEDLDKAHQIVKEMMDCNEDTFECHAYKIEYSRYKRIVAQALAQQREGYEKRIKALIEAGDELEKYSEHDVRCTACSKMSTRECDCGCGDAISNWQKAKGETK